MTEGRPSLNAALDPFVEDADFVLYVGDVRDVLAKLPDESVDCTMTSPPFYALRDYGVDGQIGLEASVGEWVEALVGVFAQVRRVLKPEGTLWIECGDSYNSGTGAGRQGSSGQMADRSVVGARMVGYWQEGGAMGDRRIQDAETKPKDLLLTPFLLAQGLRTDGWWLRQAIIWHKPNAMPESATDRCTTAHSYVFLLSKSARYWFDAEAIAEPAEWARWGDQTTPKYEGQDDKAAAWIKPKTKAEIRAIDGFSRRRGSDHRDARVDGKGDREAPEVRVDGMKNPRSVWTIPTQGYPEAHFATWPEALCERIIKAGCPEGGTVLDPFMGAGTTALVARRFGRKAVGVELNPEYAELCARRLGQQSLLTEGAA